MRVCLTKIETLPEGQLDLFYPPRTPSIEGFCESEPVLGETFVVVGRPLNPDAVLRRWQTSRVLTLTQLAPDEWEFTTENSRYHLQALRDARE